MSWKKVNNELFYINATPWLYFIIWSNLYFFRFYYFQSAKLVIEFRVFHPAHLILWLCKHSYYSTQSPGLPSSLLAFISRSCCYNHIVHSIKFTFVFSLISFLLPSNGGGLLILTIPLCIILPLLHINHISPGFWSWNSPVRWNKPNIFVIFS